MLRVDSHKPCQLVYSLAKHDFLGYLIEPHIVQLNPNGSFSLTHQRIFSNTAEEFKKHITEEDFKIIKILDGLEQGAIIKKIYKKNIRPLEFFTKHWDDKSYDTIRPKLEKKIAEAIPLLKDKQVFLMSKEGWPVERKVEITEEPATILFHFRRNEIETRYFPTIKYQGLRVEFMFKDAQIVSNNPALLLVENSLYYFDQNLEGKKLQPFLNKRYISIPKSSEQTYFEKFVSPLIEKHHVYAEGFTINTEKYQAVPVLKVVYVPEGISELQLYFRYANYVFPAGNNTEVSVKMERHGDDYLFHRIKRSLKWEKDRIEELTSLGLKKNSNLFIHFEVDQNEENIDKSFSVFDWISENHDRLIEKGYVFEADTSAQKYIIGTNKIDLEIQENNDWFDINAIVHFGIYKIPFIQLKNHILNKKREFTLPNGEIAIIPEKWFSQYGNLLSFSEGTDHLQLKKLHVGLVHDFASSELASVTMDRKLQRLTDFEHIEEVEGPIGFHGNLRPYQHAGYNWFHFLQKYNFGGCLADDMGLGKTIQTLALLQKSKEIQEEQRIHTTSLIVMPTSLIYNWINEAKKFTPQLKIYTHTGSGREKNIDHLSQFDVVITTYGISRIDIDLLKEMYFNYIILDESQNIKNPTSKAFKAIKQLNSRYKLILSGTPVENTVNDLWTQMSFINPGLLGSQSFFQSEFVQPIEKKKDEEKAHKLQALIKPFVMRRTKEQVASELPPKTENIFFSEMTEDQADFYEKTKSEYRNELLKSIENGEFSKSPVQMLQGLTKLRQIANHPVLINHEYEGESSKFTDVIYKLQSVIEAGHKVLVFSQFVKQLDLYRNYFDKNHIAYSYLDGSTQQRGKVVEEFKNDKNIQVFLISIKAGGVGLNLTEADYVFILDPWWNPAIEQQAIDRSHRIGQTKNVFIYKFITKDTVEEKILALQNRKLTVAKSLITTEESFIKSLSEEDIKEILG
ncbi:SNF2-related protein [Pseudopedobacter saltans DSM 12145]|uniref:SNF2-related protein n=1 Tax=Pseudopedobacter saltans (strain ATCC 51119 / DSM 12145 / JCM 21818 / CCUG 39354 / LMG 10337 / NBRC 100064 / NCIMB 13643) TaxID=762903 RepID=F0SA31_PSESL|nr:SNF2-related protein [Pseudopedobacter saltans]ADY53595.1 SNF2-related protein [Pseudopedobacter saltans DSM 12145]